MTELNFDEIDSVAGGIAFVPIAVAFGKGFAVGAAAGAIGKMTEMLFEVLTSK